MVKTKRVGTQGWRKAAMSTFKSEWIIKGKTKEKFKLCEFARTCFLEITDVVLS